MVVKIQASHPHMEGTLSYNQRKVEKGVARVVSAVNLPSAFPGDIRRTFSRYDNRNRVTERVSFQLSINPDPGRPEERLTDGEVRDFAAALMDGLGYGSQPYVIYEHADIDRTHYHVVSVRTDWEGRKIRDYREQYRCQRLLKENAQRFHYRVGEGLGRMKQPSPAKGTFDLKAGDIRNQYRSLFHKAMRYSFTTLPQLKAVCSSLGLLLDTRDTPLPCALRVKGPGLPRPASRLPEREGQGGFPGVPRPCTLPQRGCLPVVSHGTWNPRVRIQEQERGYLRSDVRRRRVQVGHEGLRTAGDHHGGLPGGGQPLEAVLSSGRGRPSLEGSLPGTHLGG